MRKDEFMIRHPDLYAEIKLEGYERAMRLRPSYGKCGPAECVINTFLEHCCVRDSLARDRATLLYGTFREWYKSYMFSEEINPDAYETAPSSTWFGRQLSMKFEKLKSGGVIFYKGIRRK
ncbi:MAG TPA: hypothetical protein DDY86_07095 [Syntrophaceae bacterium]|nr:hypothetical protein [Syntrophaceae bacterium]